jgi:hypothetical protein
MASDYKVSISILLENGVSAVLALMTREMRAFQGTVDEVGGSFKKWGALIADAGLVDLLGHMVDKAAELRSQTEKLVIAGTSYADIQRETAKAWDVSSKFPVTPTEALGHEKELNYIFGNPDAAMAHIDETERANMVLNAAMKAAGNDDAKDQVYALNKAMESKGDTVDSIGGAAEYSKMLDLFVKASEATGGKVIPDQFYQSFKYGRLAMQGWDDDFVGSYLPRTIQEYGGSSAGTALMSVFSANVRGQMPKKAAEEFKALGLVDPNSKEGDAGYSTVLGGEVQGRDEFMANPYKWVQDVLMPTLAAHGITAKEDVIAEVGKLYQNRTASGIIGTYATQGSAAMGENSPFEKDARLNKQAMTAAQSAAELMANDPGTVMKEFTTQWDALLTALGDSSVSPAISAMKNIADMLRDLAQAAHADPAAAKVVFDGLAALAIALPGMMAGFAVGGPVGAAIGALAGGLAALGALNWDSVKAGIKALDDLQAGVSQFGTQFRSDISAIPAELVDAISKLPSEVSGAIDTAFAAIAHNIATAAGGLLGGVEDWIKSHNPFAQKTGYEAPTGQKSLLQNAAWQPEGKQAMSISVPISLNIDGRALAESMSEEMAMLFTFPSSAPSSGAGMGYTPNDSGTTAV